MSCLTGIPITMAKVILTLCAIVSITANAQVYISNVYGNDVLGATDPQTDLQWLRQYPVRDLSMNDILSGAGGWTASGFRVATQDEVIALWYRLGIDEIGPATAANMSGANTIFSTIGQCFAATRFKYGILFDDAGQTVLTLVEQDSDKGVASAAIVGPVNLDFHDPCAGVYLVRDVAPDLDNDGVINREDNCVLTQNPIQRDTNSDGYGNLCDPDFNGNGIVNFLDFGAITAAFNTTNNEDIDLDGDGAVNFLDLVIYRNFFGGEPGPSGLVNH